MFSQVDKILLMQWNDVFFYFSILSIVLAFFLFGIPYITSSSVPFLSKTLKAVDQMRLQKFFGRIAILSLAIFVLIALIFLFRIVYTTVVYLQLAIGPIKEIDKLNGYISYGISLGVSLVIIFFTARWLKKQWRESANDATPNTEQKQLKMVLDKLNSKLDKLDKLDKIDKLVLKLEAFEKHQEQVNHSRTNAAKKGR